MNKIQLIALMLSSIFIRISATNIMNIQDTTYSIIKMSTIINSQRIISESPQTIQIKTVSKKIQQATNNSSQILKNIKVSRNPAQVIITNDNKFAFIRCYFSNTIELINIAKGEIIKSFLIPSPFDLSLSNDGAKLIVLSIQEVSLDPSLYPDDCTQFIFISPTAKSVLTIIDISKQEIEKTYTIETKPCSRRILNSSNNDIIYLATDYGIIEVNIKNLIINKRWQFSKQIWYSEIDKKNNRIFMVNISDTLKVINLANGAIHSAPLYVDTTFNTSTYIAIDTLSNRIFVQGKFVGVYIQT